MLRQLMPTKLTRGQSQTNLLHSHLFVCLAELRFGYYLHYLYLKNQKKRLKQQKTHYYFAVVLVQINLKWFDVYHQNCNYTNYNYNDLLPRQNSALALFRLSIPRSCVRQVVKLRLLLSSCSFFLETFHCNFHINSGLYNRFPYTLKVFLVQKRPRKRQFVLLCFQPKYR